MAADLLEDDKTIEQEGHGRELDPGAAVLLAEVMSIIADRLRVRDIPESEMLAELDGVPMSIVLLAADHLGFTVPAGVWRRA